MKRAIVSPPVLSPAALGEIKAWLGISTTRDDAELTALTGAALDICEGFIGQIPLLAGCEEVICADTWWQTLSTRPVQAITTVAALGLDGVRRTLPASAYMLDLDADGTGRVRLTGAIAERRLVVTFTAGLATGWDTLPQAIRQGVVRLVAHHHREREGDKPAPTPPAAVAALWRPWRRVRLT